MMLLQYLIQGAWYVTMGTFLSKTLHCTDIEIGKAYGFTALAFIISPLFMGLVADRFFDSEKLLGILHLVGAILLYAMFQSATFDHFFGLLIVYMLLYAPTVALTSSITMQQVGNPEKDFPSIRVFGTIGWIIAGVMINALHISEYSPTPFLLASIGSGVLGLFAFTLPRTAPKMQKKSSSLYQMLGLNALSLMKDRSIALLLVCVFLIYIPITFYFQLTNMFMNELGWENTASTQTLGQVSEIGFMLLLPLLMRWLGLKRMILLGMIAWALRYLLFAYADIDTNAWAVYGGIILHGICYDFLFVSTQIYLDKKAPDDLRSSLQALVATVTYGFGMFIGAYVTGFVAKQFMLHDTLHDWKSIWLVAMTSVGVVTLLFWVLFQNRTDTQHHDM